MEYFSDLSKDEGEILGPGTDLVVSLVAVLIILLSIYSRDSQQKIAELEKIVHSKAEITQVLADKSLEIERLKRALEEMKERNSLLDKQDLILKKIKDSQLKIIKEIALKNNTEVVNLGAHKFEIDVKSVAGKVEKIKIRNDATLQRISFGSAILFNTGSDVLKWEGKMILKNIASVFKQELSLIKEIQIQGHADADFNSIKMKNDNMDLAARRAISIVRYLRDNSSLNIDPSKHVLYASSFGLYMPVERDYLDTDWDLNKIKKINDKGKGKQNRRIEVVINYRELF